MTSSHGSPRKAPLTDRALVLRRYRYGETSLVVHALTPHHGSIAVLAKGAYRLQSGYCGVLDHFDTLELAWRPTRGELATLSAARIVVRRREMGTDLGRYRAGLSLLELAYLGSHQGSGEGPLFAELETTLELVSSTLVDPPLALVNFDLRWLGLAGLSPACERCAACGRSAHTAKRRPRAFFSHARGGLLCTTCRSAPGPGKNHFPRRLRAAAEIDGLPWQVVQCTSRIARTPPGELAELDLQSSHVLAAGELTTGFLEYHLERRLESRRGPLRSRAHPEPGIAGTPAQKTQPSFVAKRSRPEDPGRSSIRAPRT